MSIVARFLWEIRRGQAYEIPTNSVQFIPFQSGDMVAGVGSRDLKGATIVVIGSSVGVIMAHIPPGPHHLFDHSRGMENMKARMVEVLELCRQYHSCILTYRYSMVICAVLEDKILFHEQVGFIQNLLAESTLDPETFTYNLRMGIEWSANPEKGVIYVDASNEEPAVYLEGRCIG